MKGFAIYIFDKKILRKPSRRVKSWVCPLPLQCSASSCQTGGPKSKNSIDDRCVPQGQGALALGRLPYQCVYFVDRFSKTWVSRGHTVLDDRLEEQRGLFLQPEGDLRIPKSRESIDGWFAWIRHQVYLFVSKKVFAEALNMKGIVMIFFNILISRAERNVTILYNSNGL